MRICITGVISGRGGIQTHLRGLVEALAADEHELLLVSFAPTSEGQEEVIRDSFIRFTNLELEFPRGPEAPPFGISSVARLRGRISRFAPDVYFACGTGWGLLALPLMLSIKHRVFHEVMSGVAGGPRDSRWLVRLGFTDVVAQATTVAANFRKTFGWREKIPVLPAFPEALERNTRVPAARKHAVPFGTARAALFSRLVPHKRACWLVNQWPLLADSLAELHIFGAGPEETAIRESIARLGIGGRVFCRGTYPSGQAYVDLLNSFNLTLLPTVGAEGAPLVLLESMACGVPFVATDAGGISDYTNPDCLITSHRNLDTFVTAVESLAQQLHREEINQPRLQTFYAQRFSFQQLSERWRTFFSSLQ